MKQILLFTLLFLRFVVVNAQTNFINQDSVVVANPLCTDSVVICVDSANYDELPDWTFKLNGSAFTTDFLPCDSISAHFLDFSTFLGDAGPFALDSFRIGNDVKTITSFASFNILIDSLRKWYPTTVWTFDSFSQFAIGEDKNFVALSPIYLRSLSSSKNTSVGDSPAKLYRGLKFKIKTGRYTLEVKRISTGEFDNVTLVGATCPSTSRKYVFNDTITVGLPARIKADFTKPATPTSITEACTSVKNNIQFTINSVNYSVAYSASKVGRDSICIRVCDAANICDTTIFYIQGLPAASTPTNLIRINIPIDADTIICLDTSRILGRVDTVFDACPGKNGSKARMVLSRITKCISVSGLTKGLDTLCAVIRNNQNGRSDTITIIANVIDTTTFTGVLKANPDLYTLNVGPGISPDLTLFVYNNDSLGGRRPTSLTLVQPPKGGKADTISFTQGIIVYRASKNPRNCGIDTFRYRVCIDTLCSEALVQVLVVCNDSLKVYNFISPNGDGKNDVFVIEGLQKYPNNTLLIYNRWGNEVHKVKNYQNDWQGSWNTKILPDGTYFYMLQNNDNNTVILTGYLQLQR